MATVISPSLRASLSRLKHAGSVNGIGLAWRRQNLVNLTPFESYRVDAVVQILNDARIHFESGSGDRSLDTVWMAFENAHLLALFSGEITLYLLHSKVEEADFLTQVANTCLQDCQLLIDSILNQSSDDEDEFSNLEDPDQPIVEPPPLDPNQTHIMA